MNLSEEEEEEEEEEETTKDVKTEQESLPQLTKCFHLVSQLLCVCAATLQQLREHFGQISG